MKPLSSRETGWDGRTECSCPTVAFTQQAALNQSVAFELDEIQGRQLYILVDSGADISLVKSKK